MVKHLKLKFILISILFIGVILITFKHWYNSNVETDNLSLFEPDVYYAQVIQVGGIGSDLYTNRAWCEDCYANKNGETLQGFLNKDTFAKPSFNSINSMMSLWCINDRYTASVWDSDPLHPYDSSKNPPYGDIDDGHGRIWGYGIEIRDQIKNVIAIKCQRH